MEFASIAIPAGGAVLVSKLSLFSVGFGDLIKVQGSFLSGRVSVYVQIWNCCCWYCGWSCCFRCGGGFNTRRDYVIFNWAGINPGALNIDSRTNMCASIMDASTLPPPAYHPEAMQRAFEADYTAQGVGVLGVDPDSESYCLCVGPYNLRPDVYFDYTPQYYAERGWNQSVLAPIVRQCFRPLFGSYGIAC